MKQSNFWLFAYGVIFGCLLSLLAVPAAADSRNALGKGAASLESAHQGKLYCSLTHVVSTRYSGEVAEKLVGVGQYVKKGQPLLKVILMDAVANNFTASIDREMEILNAKVSIAALKKSIEDVEKMKREQKELASEGMGSTKKVVQFEDQLVVQRLQLTQAERHLEKIYKDLKRQRQFLSKSLGQKVVTKIPNYATVEAPITGYIIWESPNSTVGALATGNMFIIGVMDPMIIRTRMYEADVMPLKVGDTAEVILEYDADKVMNAKVKSIAWMPVNQGIDVPSYYTVEMEIPNPNATLREGYMVRVLFPQKQ